MRGLSTANQGREVSLASPSQTIERPSFVWSSRSMSKRRLFSIAPAMAPRLAWLLLLVAAWTLTAPPPAHADDEKCRQDSPTVFAIQGEIDDAMAACVEARFQPATTELVLNSSGGSVEAAIAIARHFEGRRLTMRVRKECSSSCANYFLPLAGRLIVEPGALIVIHGGIDPMLIEKTRNQGEPDLVITALSQLAELQLGFARRNAIPPGWLMYRNAGGTAVEALDGAWGEFSASTRAYIVEEKMARSCLAGVEIDPFQEALDSGPLSPRRAPRLHRQGIARSASVVCNSMGWDEVVRPRAKSVQMRLHLNSDIRSCINPGA